MNRRFFGFGAVTACLFTATPAAAGKFSAVRKMLQSLSRSRTQKPVQRSARQSALDALDGAANATTITAGIATIASISVMQKVEEQGSGSVEEAALAYYALLNFEDRLAALGMWVNPDSSHSAWDAVTGVNDSEYRLMSLSAAVQGERSYTDVQVLARTNKGPWEEYFLRINWIQHETSWLIVNQQS